MAGISVGTISKATNGIDRWFLYEIQKICTIEKELAKYDLDNLPIELLREAKVNGFSDEQIQPVYWNMAMKKIFIIKEKRRV